MIAPLWPRGHVIGGRRVEPWGGCARHPDMRRWRKPRLVLVDAHQSAAALDVGEIAITLARGHLVVVVSEDPLDHLGLDPGLIRAAPVSDQIDADRLIPALLDCPARWRAVVLDGSSAVNLARWLRERCPECGTQHGRRDRFEFGCDCNVPARGTALDLVLVAGQVGKGAAVCDLVKVRELRDQCLEAKVGFTIARLGSRVIEGYRRGGYRRAWAFDTRSRTGADPSEWPADLRPYAAAAGPLAGEGS